MVQIHLGPLLISGFFCFYPAAMTEPSTASRLDLLDWKRRVFALYAEVRSSHHPQQAWRRWRGERDQLFATHPQSPLAAERRATFAGLDYFDYDPVFRVRGEVVTAPPDPIEIADSHGSSIAYTRFATVAFVLGDTKATLDAYWLEGYGGGLFLPFADATSGQDTYGAGRYLLDTVKGADLGEDNGRLVLDFNFAYNPSCSYDPAWVCPLAPPENRLLVAVEAGERLGA